MYFKDTCYVWSQNRPTISDVLGVIDSRKKLDHKNSSEVGKMLGCLKCKYENCIFIFQWLKGYFYIHS